MALPRDLSEKQRQTNSWRSGLDAEANAWRVSTRSVSGKAATVARVFKALVLRELMTRFGRQHLGFVWLVLEPLILTTLVIIWWSMAFGSTKGGVAIVPLALSGYSMITLWRHMIGRFIHCFRHNAPLMFHRNVKPLDTIFARLFLETTGALLSFFVAYTALYIFDLIGPIYDILLLLSGWYLLALFSFAVALSLAALCELWEPAEKFVQPLLYVTIPLTGLFFMVSWLPSHAQQLALLSPIVHTFEMFRGGLIGPSIQTHYQIDFVIYVTTFLIAFGFFLMRKAEAHIKIE